MRSARMNCSRQRQQQAILRVWMFFFSLIQKVHCSLPSPQNVAIVSFNLEHKLTWTPGSGTTAFTHFRVQSYNQKRRLWISVNNCSDLQIGESCDLTEHFKETFGLYQARVQAFSTDQESNWTTSKYFTPMLDNFVPPTNKSLTDVQEANPCFTPNIQFRLSDCATLGPPLVSLSGCGNCLLLKLSPPASVERSHDPLPYLYKQYTVNVCRTRDKTQFSLKASNGETLINYLEPGVEYCITAIVVTNFKNLAVPSDPQCTYTSPQPLNRVAMFLSALCAVFLLALLLLAALIYTGQLKKLHTPLLRVLVSFLSFLERR